MGGRLVVPVGSGHQELTQIDRVSPTEFTKTSLMAVQYVPLTDLHTQLR